MVSPTLQQTSEDAEKLTSHSHSTTCDKNIQVDREDEESTNAGKALEDLVDVLICKNAIEMQALVSVYVQKRKHGQGTAARPLQLRPNCPIRLSNLH